MSAQPPPGFGTPPTNPGTPPPRSPGAGPAPGDGAPQVTVYGPGDHHHNHDGPEWQTWTWTSGTRGVPWLGILLLLLGAALFIQQLRPEINIGSLFILATGIAFLAAWLISGWRWASVPGFFLVALALAQLLEQLEVVSGPGWTPLLLGLGLVAAWLAAAIQHMRRDWALLIGIVLVLYGLAQVSNNFSALSNVEWLWPVLLIVLGIYLLMRRRPGY